MSTGDQDDHANLEMVRGALLAQNRYLLQSLCCGLRRLVDWWSSKCDEMEEEIVALKMENSAIQESVQQISRKLEDMSSQKEGLLIHNAFLQETLDELEKKLEKEQTQRHQMKEEIQALIQEKSLLKHQIQEDRLSAGGEHPGLCVVV